MLKNSDINIRDPFVLVYKETYYLYGTRAANFGCCTGGFDVYKGKDLENWEEPIQVFDSEKYGLNKMANWAPEVHEYNGRFWMFATFVAESGMRGTYILESDSPEGPFVPHTEDPVTPEEWECLDGTLYIEDGKPYLVFCHEHTQITDGTVCFAPLADDLSHITEEPKVIFKASDFLTKEVTEAEHGITDGPYMHRLKNGTLLLIWSTVENGYKQCVAVSENGKISGKFTHLEPIFKDDGGHGMVFRDFEGKLRLTLHCPNIQGSERPVFFEIHETEETITI